MSDRLKELQRQRVLLQEHLAWLDREIARETGEMPAVAGLLEAKPAPAASAAPAHPATAIEAAADIMARYTQETPGDMARNAKRGCMLYFIFAFVAFGLFLLGVYVYYTQFRETRESPPAAEARPGN